MISVLYVDDEPGLLDIARIFLEKNGQFSVDTVTTASAALEILGLKKHEAIISDYQMAVMDGIEFLKKVRAAGNTIPFIIFTGRGREEIVIQAMNEGADFYLQKGGDPVAQFAELGHKIRMAVEQRRAETSIRDLERRQADIINFLPDATFAINTEGVVIAWNRAMERMTRVRSSEILGKGNYEYAIPFYHERRPILIDLVLMADPATAARYPYIKKDGKTLYSEIKIPHFNDNRGASLWFTASPLYDTQGKIVGAIESIREITERKQAEEGLRESERKYRTVFETTGTAMILVENDTTISLVNSEFERLSGYTKEEVENKKKWTEFVVEEDQDWMLAQHKLRRTDPGKALKQYEFRYITRSGDVRDIFLSIDVIPGSTKSVASLLDITERKKAESALRESEQRYRNVVEDQTEFISRFTPDGTHVFVNEAYCRYFGVKREEILGHRFRPVIHPDDTGRVKRFFKSLTPEHPVDIIEQRIIMPGGKIQWQRWSDRAIFDTAGNVIEYQSVGRDTTEKKQAEEVLKDAKEYAEKLIQTANAMIIGLDRYGTITAFNQAAEMITGYTSAELAGRNWFEAVVPKDRYPYVWEEFNRLMSGGLPKHFENPILTKSGEERYIVWKNSEIRDKEQIVGTISYGIDITERKHAEEALRESEERFRKIYENSPVGMTLVTQDFRFFSVNPAWISMTGYSEEELLKMTFKDITHPDHLASDMEHIQELVAGTIPIYSTEKRYIRKDGSILWGLLRVTTIRDQQGALRYFATQIEDITERKKAEEALRENEERLYTILQAVQTGIIIIDAEKGTILDANRKALSMIGTGPDEVIGSVCHRFICPCADGRCPVTDLQQMIDTTERVLITGSGETIPILKTVIPATISGRKVLVESFLDISDMKKRDERIRLLAGLLDITPASVTVHDLNGNFLYANAMTFIYHGYTEEEFYRINLHELDIPETQRMREMRTAEALKERKLLSFEVKHFRKDRSILPLLVNAKITEWEGRPVILSVATDITERKREEEALKMRKKKFRAQKKGSAV